MIPQKVLNTWKGNSGVGGKSVSEGKYNGFWDNQIRNFLNGIINKKTSVWKIILSITYKYDLPVKVQGFGALTSAKEILSKHEKVLTEEEKQFLKKVLNGELM